VFRQCHLTSKAPCFYRNRRHGSSFPTRRVRCSVVQPMAPPHPRSAGLIRQTKSSLTCLVSGEYSAYTSKRNIRVVVTEMYLNDFHEDVNSNRHLHTTPQTHRKRRHSHTSSWIRKYDSSVRAGEGNSCLSSAIPLLIQFILFLHDNFSLITTTCYIIITLLLTETVKVKEEQNPRISTEL
jgi:hypothetical protein